MKTKCSHCGEDYSALSDVGWGLHNGESEKSIPNCIQAKNDKITELIALLDDMHVDRCERKKQVKELEKDKARIDWLDQSKPCIQLHHTVERAWEVNHLYMGRIGGPTSFRDALDRAMQPRDKE